MIEQELIRFIKDKANKIRERLSLPIIQVEIDNAYNNCSAYTGTQEILIGLFFINKLKNKKDELNVVPSDTFLNRVYFVIAHECAHILQAYKFPKWYDKCKKAYITNLNSPAYTEQRIEKNASKIASILLKEYKEEEEKC